MAVDRPGCLGDKDRIVSGSGRVGGVTNGTGGDETRGNAA
jgi:hypothetical protein